MNKKIISVLLTALICVGLQSTLLGYAVKLNSDRLNLNRGEKDTTLVVINEGSTPAAVQVSVIERVPSGNSFLTKEKATKDFKVMPNKLIALPGQDKSVAVNYRAGTPSQEKQYFVFVEQMDIKKKTEGRININVLMNYKKVLSVGTTKFKHRTKVSADKVNEDGTAKLKLTFTNSGSGAYYDSEFKNLSIKTSKGKVSIPKEAFLEKDEIFFLFPNQTVTRIVPWPKDISTSAKVKSVKMRRG